MTNPQCEYSYICEVIPLYRKTCKGNIETCKRRNKFIKDKIPKQLKLFTEEKQNG